MSKLIKNELIKIFKKKTLYVSLAIILAMMVFLNCMTKFGNSSFYFYERDTSELKQALSNYNPENPADTSTYIDLKTEIDIAELLQQYKKDSWQVSYIEENMRGTFATLNTLQYGPAKNVEEYKQKKAEYDQIKERLDKDDWKYFVNVQMKEVKKEIKDLNDQKEATIDKAKKEQIANEITRKEMKQQILQWRIEKNISYARSDMNTALLNYEQSMQTLESMRNNPDGNADEMKSRINTYESRAALAKYSIEQGTNVQKQDSSKSMLMNFFDMNGIFIAAFLIMIAGTIIAEEFSKGTIKLLLVRPYPRWKILLAKFITCVIVFVVITIAMMVMQTIIGGFVFGFDSMQTPAVYYSFENNQVETMNLFGYLGLQTLTRLPMFLLLIAISFMLGAMFTNSALAIIIPLLGFMSSSMINMMAMELNLSFMKFFITPNWDLTPYLFGGVAEFPGISLPFSIIISIVYFIVMMIPAFWIFQKRNIKNI